MAALQFSSLSSLFTLGKGAGVCGMAQAGRTKGILQVKLQHGRELLRGKSSGAPRIPQDGG